MERILQRRHRSSFFHSRIACLGTSCPTIWALVSIAFVLVLLLHFQQHFPKRIRELREEQLEEVDELTLLGIEKKYFGLKAAFSGFFAYYFGLGFLLFVAGIGCTFPGCDLNWHIPLLWK